MERTVSYVGNLSKASYVVLKKHRFITQDICPVCLTPLDDGFLLKEEIFLCFRMELDMLGRDEEGHSLMK